MGHSDNASLSSLAQEWAMKKKEEEKVFCSSSSSIPAERENGERLGTNYCRKKEEEEEEEGRNPFEFLSRRCFGFRQTQNCLHI